MWRPGARVAEYVLGEQTTGSGKVIQKVSEASAPIWGWNLAVRLAGARPYDEAILSDSYFRQIQYKADKTAAAKNLISAARLSIAQGRELDMESLSEQFIQGGGNPRELRNWIRKRYNEMNVTEAERFRKQLLESGHTTFAQQLDIPTDE